jgi:hypothetical protein
LKDVEEEKQGKNLVLEPGFEKFVSSLNISKTINEEFIKMTICYYLTVVL